MATVINQILAQESGRFEKDILQNTIHVSPILDLMPEGTWSPEMGSQLKVLMYGRSLPASTYVDGGDITNTAYDGTFWTDVGSGNFDSSSENNCTPPVITVQMGSDSVSFNLQHMAINSQELCATDIMQSFSGARQLEAIKNNLSDITGWTLAEKFRRDYTYWCAHKVVVTVNGTVQSTAAGGIANAGTFNFASGPTSLKSASAGPPGRLRQELLDELYTKLFRRGAGRNALFQKDGGPVFALITDNQTSGLIKRQTGIREDFHWSNRSNELLDRLAISSAPVLGFQHMIDPIPPRWNVSAGAWVKVEPYIVRAGTEGGFVIDENPAYESAAWQDTIIFHQDVIEEVYPNSIGNTAGTGFTPVNYRGVWRWVNIPRVLVNEDGDMGHFRGRFMLGAMPRYTNRGVIIRHAVCSSAPAYSACSIN